MEGHYEVTEPSLAALDAAKALLSDVDSLLDHHPNNKDPKPGRPAGAGYGPLLRSCVALCYTAWEVYVEESLLESVRYFVRHGSPEELPEALQQWVVGLKPSPWAFVGEAWGDTVIQLAEARIYGDAQGRYGFNTASVSNVESLFNEVLGYSPLYGIRWQKKTNTAVRKDISELVRIRGEIVHRGTTPGSLNLSGVRSWASFVSRLCERVDEQLVAFREGQLKALPEELPA
ncbi:hypothetical protein ACFXG4_50710 [Nocardia sp. NPDC059246]|uniref:hypothetical protein n=1 Tax=unclassified Nocardia TaxID=2637762 RepID=UPI003699F65A